MKPNVPGDEIYIVSVDSRGKSPSDLECYKEHSCSFNFFEQHIHDNPKNICVKSQVAGLAGLDLKVYFHEHSPYQIHYSDNFRGLAPLLGRTNGIATLLTFNPETGYYNHLVRGKAYVLLNDGTTRLSKRQVWGIQELIHEAKDLYHQSGGRMSNEAHMELLTWCAQYQQGTWAPHRIYERRHLKHHRCCIYRRHDSGRSDQATCHHGLTHIHHNGHHDCCRCNEETGGHVEVHPTNDHHIVSPPKGEETNDATHERE
jgi:hypothetical protein